MSSSYNVFINTHYLIQNIDRFSVLDSSEFVYPVIYCADKTDEQSWYMYFIELTKNYMEVSLIFELFFDVKVNESESGKQRKQNQKTKLHKQICARLKMHNHPTFGNKEEKCVFGEY